MSFSNCQNKLARKPVWLAKINLDYCQKSYCADCPFLAISQQAENEELEIYNRSTSSPPVARFRSLSQGFFLVGKSKISRIKIKILSTGLTAAWNGEISCALGENISNQAVAFPAGDHVQLVQFDFDNPELNTGDHKFTLQLQDSQPAGSYFYLANSNANPYAGGHVSAYDFYLDVGLKYEYGPKDLWFEISGVQLQERACYYTYNTCQDLAAYLPQTKTYRFCSRDSLVGDALPLLKEVTLIPTEIDSKNTLTRRGDLTVKFSDDSFLPGKANPDKDISNTETQGTYWRNWLARNRNYYHRIVEIYLGFEGLEEAEYKLYFRGLIENIIYQNFGAEIHAKDLLKKLDAQSHVK